MNQPDVALITSTRQVAAMTTYATDLALAYPQATAPAIADKLLTVWPGSDALVRRAVAWMAILAADAQAAA